MTMLSINTNVGALQAARSSYSVNKSMEQSMERLASGKRVNSAADDAAGLAISTRLNAEIQGINQSVRNAADAQGRHRPPPAARLRRRIQINTPAQINSTETASARGAITTASSEPKNE